MINLALREPEVELTCVSVPHFFSLGVLLFRLGSAGLLALTFVCEVVGSGARRWDFNSGVVSVDSPCVGRLVFRFLHVSPTFVFLILSEVASSEDWFGLESSLI